MNPPSDLKDLQADIPACPRTLTDMVRILSLPDATAEMMADVVAGDMALASAVVRTVNSAMYGLLRRVSTVHEAVRYLGANDVAGITFATALRAAFPSTPMMEQLWERSSHCSLLMSRSASGLGLDPWQAHSAGLFARTGEAVLMSKQPEFYEAWRAEHHPPGLQGAAELAALEQDTFGFHHAHYGSALCAAWGMAPDVVTYVRERIEPATRWERRDAPVRNLLILGAVTEALLDAGDTAACLHSLADLMPETEADQTLESVRPRWSQLQQHMVPHNETLH